MMLLSGGSLKVASTNENAAGVATATTTLTDTS
jgi:hypothetical protein